MKTKTIVWIFMCLISVGLTAQQRKVKTSQTIDVAKDVSIDLNTSYVEIEVDTWNKGSLEIEAYVEGKQLSDTELQKALDAWGLDIDASTNRVSISSTGSYGSWDEMADIDMSATMDILRDLEMDLADIPEIPEIPEIPAFPQMPQMALPEMPEMPELPELPEGINEVQFDTEAYRKDGETYLDNWSKEYEKKYGKKYQEQMKDWARKMEKVDFSEYEAKMEAWGEQFGEKFGDEYAQKMEVWGEEFSKRFDGEWQSKMEAWGERYGKQMERRAEQQQKRLELQESRKERLADRQKVMAERQARLATRGKSASLKVKRVIKIKMPKDAKVNLNVRHGELKLSSVINNLKASVSHASLLANHIDGGETSINVSYSPVAIDLWSMGELKLNYVENADLKTVGTMVLFSNSSNIEIGSLTGNAVIDGSFGDLTVAAISDSFNNLSIILDNSDALISLPQVAHHFQFKGNRSSLVHPKKNSKDKASSFSAGHLSSNKNIMVNAKFSEVTMQ